MNQKNLDGAHVSALLDKPLALYAQKNAGSRGRKFPEVPDPNRGPFQRDRDRIIHTTAFRRLGGKMQVVAPSVGDHFRNRLTHTLEVSQIARDLARQLCLNEDLAEAIALAHDLGHPPFGHAGEEALNQKMQQFGQEFEHNSQSLRIVEFFERRYSKFPGLNLTYEVLEGLQKHTTFFDRPDNDSIFSSSLEAQLVDVSDEIAYLSADLEDGMRGDFFKMTDLVVVEICATALAELSDNEKKSRSALIRCVIRNLFIELVTCTRKNLKEYKIQTLNDVQRCQSKVIAFSPEFFHKFCSFKEFLMDRYYCAPEVYAATEHGQKVVSEIFDYLHAHPEELPQYLDSDDLLEVRICDYVAGMTDAFAEKFWKKI